MTFILAENTAAGPIVKAEIAWDEETIAFSEKNGTPPPERSQIRMLVDTGATISSVSDVVVKRLFLSQRGSLPIRTASANPVEDRPIYYVSIHLLDETSVSSHRVVPVTSYPDIGGTVQGLLGWDVLQHCNILYRKDTKAFSLEF